MQQRRWVSPLTGDIHAAEKGGPGHTFDDEETYPRGTVAMGNWGPDTNGSAGTAGHRDGC